MESRTGRGRSRFAKTGGRTGARKPDVQDHGFWTTCKSRPRTGHHFAEGGTTPPGQQVWNASLSQLTGRSRKGDVVVDLLHVVTVVQHPQQFLEHGPVVPAEDLYLLR